MPRDLSDFEKDTMYRLAVEAVRFWVVSNTLAHGEMPNRFEQFVYGHGPAAALDWGDAPGPADPTMPLRGKRIRVTYEVEPWPATQPPTTPAR